MVIRKLITCTVLFMAPTALGQRDPGDVTILAPSFQYPEFKAFLQLSDSQVEALIEIQKEMREENSKIYQEIAGKQRALHGLLASGSTDYGRIGLLMVEINELQKKVPITGEPYRTRAVAALTPPQVEKLAELVAALRMAPAAHQAVSLNLIDQPQPPPGMPRPLPMPMPVATGGN
jgi:hypothetical protein